MALVTAGTDWTTVISVAVTGGLGVVGIWVASRNSRAALDHASRLAKEQRDQDRRASLYVDLLASMFDMQARRDRECGNPHAPDLPPRDVQAMLVLDARLRAFASPEVVKIWLEGLKAGGEYEATRPEGVDAMRARLPKCTAVVTKMRRRIVLELQGETNVPHLRTEGAVHVGRSTIGRYDGAMEDTVNVVALAKYVPDPQSTPQLGSDGLLVLEGAGGALDPGDEYGLELALQLAEAGGGEVTVVSMGPPEAVAAVRRALAMGAHRGGAGGR